MVDLDKVATIEIDENEILFGMDEDWEYSVLVDDKDLARVKFELLQQFKS